jgi:hypothetical protein
MGSKLAFKTRTGFMAAIQKIIAPDLWGLRPVNSWKYFKISTLSLKISGFNYWYNRENSPNELSGTRKHEDR